MSKQSEVLRCAAVTAFALLVAFVCMVGPARADDSKPATTLAGQKPKAQPAAIAPAPAKAAAAAKAARAPKPKAPKPPEKSLEEQRAADGLWAKRTSWLSVRAGYAKAPGNFTGDGFVGYGMAYQYMLTPQWSLGGAVQHDVVGRMGGASEISVPFTLELARHFRWNTVLRPYVGVGAGYYFHKYYRTSGDYAGSPGSGVYVNFGANLPVSQWHLLGIDTRVAYVQTTDGVVNPVFGKQQGQELLWSAKLNWALAY